MEKLMVLVRRLSKKRLAESLKDPKINLSAVSRLSGLSLPYLAQLKRERSMPSADTLVALADVLEKPLDYFFESQVTLKKSEEK